MLNILLVILVGIFLLFFPGLVLECLSDPDFKSGTLEKKVFLSPLISLGCYSVLFFIADKLHFSLFLPHVWWIFFILLIVLVGQLLLKKRRLPSLKRIKQYLIKHKRDYFIFVIPMILIGLLSIVAFWKVVFVMPLDDSIVHYQYINQITQTGRITFVNPGFYPFAMHILTSLVVQATTLPIETVLPVLTTLVVCLLPAGFFYLAYVLTKNRRLSLLGMLVTLLFPLLPWYPYFWGGVPFLWGMVFLVQLLGFYIEVMRQRISSQYLWVLFSSVGLFMLHSPEFITFLMALGLFIFCNPSLLKNLQSYVLHLLHVVTFVVLYLMVFVKTSGQHGTLATIDNAPTFLGKLSHLYFYTFHPIVIFGGILITLLFVMGIVLAVKKREKWLIFPVVWFIFISIFVFDSVFTHYLQFIIKFFYPWGELYRLFMYAFFSLILIAAFAFDHILGWLEKKKGKIIREIVIYLLVVFSVVSLVTPLFQIRFLLESGTPSTTDLQAITWIKYSLPSQANILNDPYIFDDGLTTNLRPADFMGWIEVMTDKKIVFPYKNRITNESLYRDSVEIINDLNEGTYTGETDSLVRQYDLNYVVWSAHTVGGRERTLEIEKLLKHPQLHLIYQTRTDCSENPVKDTCVFVFEVVSAQAS